MAFSNSINFVTYVQGRKDILKFDVVPTVTSYYNNVIILIKRTSYYVHKIILPTSIQTDPLLI